MSESQRINRLRSLLIGVVAGLIWLALNYVLKIREQLELVEVIPFYAKDASAFIFLPMSISALLAVADHFVPQRITATREGGYSSMVESAIFGAVGSVIWWVIPLAIFLVTSPLLFIASLTGAMFLTTAGQFLVGESGNADLLLFDIGLLVSGALLGAGLGGGLYTFGLGVVREMLGQSPWANKKQITIARILGIISGVVYGLFYVWIEIINGFIVAD